MISILGLMKKVRESPSRYLGEVSLDRLTAFLDGYVAACLELGLASEIENVDYDKFDDWFRRKCDVKVRSFISCISLIRLLASSDAAVFTTFFQLIDEFCAEYGASAVRISAHLETPEQSLSALLKEIRERPALHLGIASITLFAEFLRGYKYARKELKAPPSVEEKWLEDFQSWLPLRLNVHAKCSWDRVILAFYRDERDALKLFFDLFDEYLAKCVLPDSIAP